MLFTLLAFAVALGVLVTFHELGHYSVARLAGVRILRFSVGFGPVLLRRRDRHGTEWALSAIPLGGYVKMQDDPPEGGDAITRQASFNLKPLRWRVAVVLAGPVANLVLAVLIYAFLGLWGQQQAASVLAAPPSGTAAAQAGIQAGDTLLRVNGQAVVSWNEARWQLLEPLTQSAPIALELRDPDGHLRTATLHASAQPLMPEGPDPLAQAGLVLADPFPVVGELSPDAPAAQAGLKPGDRILSVGTQARPSVKAFVQTVRTHPDQVVSVVVLRDAVRLSFDLVPAATTVDGKTIGRIGALIRGQRPEVLVRLGPLDSLWSGVRQTAEMSAFTLRMMGRMVTGDVSWKNVSGPVTIAEYAGQTARIGWTTYLGFLALISISIGVLNLLPIPLLDGGHLLFYLLEALRGGRPVSERVRGWGQQIGLGLVLSLMMLALFNDFTRLFS